MLSKEQDNQHRNWVSTRSRLNEVIRYQSDKILNKVSQCLYQTVFSQLNAHKCSNHFTSFPLPTHLLSVKKNLRSKKWVTRTADGFNAPGVLEFVLADSWIHTFLHMDLKCSDIFGLFLECMYIYIYQDDIDIHIFMYTYLFTFRGNMIDSQANLVRTDFKSRLRWSFEITSMLAMCTDWVC